MILCGSRGFVSQFMIAADDMGMTDPEEYVYLLTLSDAKPPSDEESAHSKQPQRRDFRSFLQVSAVLYGATAFRNFQMKFRVS